MDKVYINIKELDIYDFWRIKNIEKEFGLQLKDNISIDELLRIIEVVFNEYKTMSNEYEDLIIDIYD